jgi:PTH1 family peptidyl-tRNA hydrolase
MRPGRDPWKEEGRRGILMETKRAAMEKIFLIVGLGNPGREYADTRHNIGFRIADRLAQTLGVRFARQQNLAFIASAKREGAKLVLAKPQTFMNLSGQSVAGLVRFYKIPPAELLVCCDDIDLPFGTIRLRASGGSAGQRGMQSILDALATKDVPRLRFGVGRPPGRMDAADYVLRAFESSEEEILPIVVEKAAQAVLTFVDGGLASAMDRFNGPLAEESSGKDAPADEKA